MKNSYLFLSVVLLITACNNEIDENVQSKIQNGSSEVVLQVRDPNLPTEWSKKKTGMELSTKAYWPVDQYIGRSYMIGNAIIGDPENVRLPVLNYSKIKDDVTPDNPGKAKIDVLTYANYDRFEKKAEIERKISSGFSLNLGLFKIGRKKKLNEKFNESIINESTRVYGEVSIEVRNGSYIMSATSSATKKMAANSLTSSFLDDLYNSSIVEVLDQYGPFVITGYYSGGRATALYWGESMSNSHYEAKESDMNSDINTSFAWGEDKKDVGNSVNLEYGFGRKNGTNTSVVTKLRKTFMTLETLGGSTTHKVNTSVGDVMDFSIDLSAWLSSLNDKSTHTLIGIHDAGLTPISSFMLEENFKRRVQDTHLGYLNTDFLFEPFIEIVKVHIRTTSAGEKLYEVAAVLNTRQGDKIVLSDGKAAQATDAELRANNVYNTFMAKSQVIANAKKGYYKCTIKADANKTIIPTLRIPLSIELKGMQESRMRKFKNESTNMWYIYDPVSLCAYSFYLDDYILDVYGMNDWIKTVPVESISLVSLYQRYLIIGL